MASCLQLCLPRPSEKGSTLKGNKLLSLGANSFLLGRPFFQEGGKNN